MALSGGIIKELLVSLGFTTDEKSLAGFTQGIGNATQKAALLGTAVTAVAGVVAAGVTKVAAATEALGYLARESGASVAGLEELGFVSEQFGVSAESARAAAQGLGHFLKSLPGAEGFLRRFGVQTRDANGKLRDTTDLLISLGDQIKDMPRWRQEAILGQVGVSADMIRVLTADVGGLRESFHRMYAAAGVDAEQAAESSRGFLNELRTLKTLAGMLAKAVSLSFMSKMRGDLEAFRRMVMDNFDKIAAVFRFLIGLVMRVAGFFGKMGLRVARFAAAILEWFHKLPPGAQRIIAAIGGILAAWKLLNLGFLASPIGVIAMLGLAIAALVDDFLTWKEGGKSLIDWSAWAPGMEAALTALKDIGAALAAAGAAIADFAGPILKILLPLLHKLVSVSFANLCDVVRAIAALFRGDFRGAFNLIASAAQRLIGFFGDLIAALGKVASYLAGKLWGAVARIPRRIGRAVAEAGAALSDFLAPVTRALRPVGDFVEATLANIRDAGKAVAALFRGDFAGAFDLVGGIIRRTTDAFLGLLDMFGGAGSAVREFMAPIMDTMLPVLDSLINATFANLRDMGKAVAALFRGDFKGAFDLIAGCVQRLIGFFGDLIAALGKVVSYMAGKLWAEIRQLPARIGHALKSVGRSIKEFFTGKSGDAEDTLPPGTLPAGADGQDMAPPPDLSSPMLTPQPSHAVNGAAQAPNVTMDQQTTIYIQAADNPQDTARAVADAQTRVNQSHQRNVQSMAW